MMPIAIAREVEAAGFYSRSFVDLIIPTNIEVENLLQNTFENAADIDNFGYLMCPTTQGINRNSFKTTTMEEEVCSILCLDKPKTTVHSACYCSFWHKIPPFKSIR